jgi:sugar phosphate isomerase/epimerase
VLEVIIMRLGSTSYVYPADILTNVRRLAGRVMDVELLLFEVRNAKRDLPDRACISELKSIAAEHCMTYTVHLPLDIVLGRVDRAESVDRAAMAIEATIELDPYGFIVHLEDGNRDKIHNPGTWLENSLKSLETLANVAGSSESLCVENLEMHAPEMLDAVLAELPVSCCIDVGHLWVTGQDDLPLLKRWLPRARVIHLHGVGHRDHQSLDKMPSASLDPVALLLSDFPGVVTMEVFSETDLGNSMRVFRDALRRVGCDKSKKPGHAPDF